MGAPGSPHVWQLIDSSGVGGAERSVERLAASLRKRGVETSIALYQDHGANPWIAQLTQAGETPVVLGGTFRSLRAAIRTARPDLIHCHGYKAGLLGRFAAALSGVPSATTFHSGETFPWPVSLYETVDLYTSLLGVRIAVSEGVAKRIPYSSTIVPNYTPTPDAPPDAPLPRRIGFVGRMSPEKAPDMFCAVARRLQNEMRDVEWVAYGDGPLRADLEREFGDVVAFKGVAIDMSAVWRSLGLLAMPSRFEGLPFAALEAAAAGVPIVASRVGGVPQVVTDGVTGWLHAADDVDAAVAGVRAWRDAPDDALLRMRAAAWAHVRARFSECDSMATLLAAYASGSSAFSEFERGLVSI